MVKECRGLMFVLETLPLEETALSEFVLSLKTQLQPKIISLEKKWR
jgi:hypothetical protein